MFLLWSAGRNYGLISMGCRGLSPEYGTVGTVYAIPYLIVSTITILTQTAMSTLKIRSNTTTIVTLAALLVACSSNERGDDMTVVEKTDRMMSEAQETARETSQDVAHMSKEAWNSFSGYTVDKKEQAAAFIDKQTDALGDEITELKRSASQATDATREKTNKAINALEEKQRDLALQAKKLRNATSETWDKVKSETQEKWNDFTGYLREAKNDLTNS